jgi:septal ring factor EnvC (AmiA/AmiB activator)
MKHDPSSRMTVVRQSLLCAVLLFSSLHALAGDANNREKEALHRTQQSLRQAQSELETVSGEKAALSQEKSKLEGVLKQVESKASNAASQAASLRSRAARLESDLAEQKAALAAAQAREAALTELLRQTEVRLAEQAQVTASVQKMLAERTRDAQTLSVQNQALYATGLDLIDLYRTQSPSTWLKARDQILGYNTVKVENLAEAMRDRLEAARFKPLTTGSESVDLSTSEARGDVK